MHETSSVMVDPVTRAISCTQQGAPTQSDASKVVAKGLGLTKGFMGQKNCFSVDCSKAGVYDCDVNKCRFWGHGTFRAQKKILEHIEVGICRDTQSQTII